MAPAVPQRVHPPVRVLRSLLLTVFLVGALGTGGELLLVGHFEDPWQLVPLALLAASLLAIAAYGLFRHGTALRAFRALLLLFPPSAVVGLYLHYRANVEFKVETYPELRGFRLFWEAIQDAAPPSLAPGAMLLLAAAGLGYTLQHPALRRSRAGTDTEGATS